MTPSRIMVAPTGARRTKADHPALPTTPAEIAAEAVACERAGADSIHLHVRDADGRHSLDAGRYREAMAAIEEVSGLSIQITTEAAGIFAPAAQLACLENVRPADASASVREIAADSAIAERFYRFANEAGVSLQHILYDDADAKRLRAAYASGLIPGSMRRAILVLGAYAPARDGVAEEIAQRLDQVADLNLDWTICAFGQNELACLAEAIRLGGNVRVGFENNIRRHDGTLAESNAEQVATIAAIRDQHKDAA